MVNLLYLKNNINKGGKLWELNQVQKELLRLRENQIDGNEIIRKLQKTHQL
jgi:hypothetical protein